MSLLYRAWRYGGGGWLEAWRLYHGLDEHLRPVLHPDAGPVLPPYPDRLRRLVYGFALAAAVVEEGAKVDDVRPKRREPEQRGGQRGQGDDDSARELWVPESASR